MVWGLVSYPWGLHSSFIQGGSVPKSNPLTTQHIWVYVFYYFFFSEKIHLLYVYYTSPIEKWCPFSERLNRLCSLLSWVPEPGFLARSFEDGCRPARQDFKISFLKAKGTILLIFLSKLHSAAKHDDTVLVTRSKVFLDPHNQGTCARWLFLAIYHLHLTMYKRARNKVVELITNAKSDYFKDKILENKDNTINLGSC